MIVRNRLTKVEYSISEEDWVIIGKRGEQSKYIVVNSDNNTSSETPTEAKKANYGDLVKEAKATFTANKFEEALELYEKALKIRETKTIKQKIAEIQEILKLNK